jgi:hypothetical protein
MVHASAWGAVLSLFDLSRVQSSHQEGLLSAADARWADALRLVEHDVYHHPEYTTIDANFQTGTASAFCYRERNDVLLIPLVIRAVPGWPDHFDAVTPYGYGGPVTNVMNDAAFTTRCMAALLATLRSHGIVTLFARLHPLLAAPLELYGEVGLLVTHGNTVSVDATQSIDEMWRHTRRGHRSQINRARRSGLHVIVDEWRHFDTWVETYDQNMRQRDASRRYLFDKAYFTALRSDLSAHVHLVTAVAPDGSFVGGMLLFEHSGIVQAHLAATAWEHPLSTDVSKLLDDETRQWAKARGASVYHLGGGHAGESGAVFDYKAGFSDRRHAFHTWRVVVDTATYAALLSAPTEDTAFFPPYRSVDA